MLTLDELRAAARANPEIQERVTKQVAALRKRPDMQTTDQYEQALSHAQAEMARAAHDGDKVTERQLRIKVLALDELCAPPVPVRQPRKSAFMKQLAATLAAAPDIPEGEREEERLPGKRRRVLVPTLEEGDLTALRYLAAWRFASPAALAALAWPERSADGQEWRMRRMVSCGLLGRRRVRFAAARHVVWARSMATQIVLNPPPPRLLVSPRWNEDSARHGWMRSVALHAYVKAGWRLQLAGTEGPVLEAFKRGFLNDAAVARLFGDGQKTYPFDLALGVRKSDRKPLLHIVIPDDLSSGLDRIMAALPFEGYVPAEEVSEERQPTRSSRVGVRFFSIDDFTFWSKSAGRYTMYSPRCLRMVTDLTNAGLNIPPENAGPEIGHWAQLQ